MNIKAIDAKVISFFNKIAQPLARFALFVVFFWFGLLKVLDLSPATELVQNLFEKTIPFMSFGTFFFWFGIFECIIGILFLIKGAERVAIPLLLFHMVLTTGPLVMLPEATWSAFMVPSMEGQYVIKNLLIISAAVLIGSRLKPLGAETSNG